MTDAESKPTPDELARQLAGAGLDLTKAMQLASRAQEGEKAVHEKLDRIDRNLTTLIKRLITSGVITEK